MRHLMKRAWTKYALVAVVTAMIIAPTAAIASHTFTDVPDTHTFHSTIQWMKDNGVTQGCNPPANDKYCPDNAVTRGQMSAFMQRLAQNKVVDAKTAVTAETATLATNATNATNADKLDGIDSISIMGAVATARWDYFDGLGTSNTTPTSLVSFTVTAPAAGYLLVQFNGQMWHDADSTVAGARTVPFDLGLCTTADSSTSCNGTWLDHWTEDADNSTGSNETVGVSKELLISVPAAGDHTFYLNAMPNTGTDRIEVWDMYASAIYIPTQMASSSAVLATTGGSGQ